MATTPAPASQASLLLQKQLKDLCKNPVDGLSAGLVNEAQHLRMECHDYWPTRHSLVESIALSIISMLSSPNDESPANVDAAKQWRESREEFRKRVGRCVRRSQEML